MTYQPLHTPLRTTKTFTAEQVEHLAGLIDLVAATNTESQLHHSNLRNGLSSKVQAGTATVDDFILLWAWCATGKGWSAREELSSSLYIQFVWNRFDDYFLAMDAAHATD